MRLRDGRCRILPIVLVRKMLVVERAVKYKEGGGLGYDGGRRNLHLQK